MKNYIFDRVFITGDTHGEFFDLKDRCEKHGLTDKDLLIIAGDFGFIRDDSWEENIQKITMLLAPHIWFIDGNHENFNILNGLPEEISHKVRHLKRASIKMINGRKFIFFGGGVSVDKGLRTILKSWREEEMYTSSEASDLLSLADEVDSVDYIVTHEGSPKHYKGRAKMSDENECYKKPNEFQNLFSALQNQISYKGWYCGHYHENISFGKHHIIYKNVDLLFTT